MATMNDQLKTVLAIWVFLLVVLATLAQEAIPTRDPAVDLDTIQTARRNGYPAESHIVQTADGYLLAAHRIPGELHSKTSTPSKSPPNPGAGAAPGAAAAGAEAAAVEKLTAAVSSLGVQWALGSRITNMMDRGTTTQLPLHHRITTTLLAEVIHQHPTRVGDAQTRNVDFTAADIPPLLHIQMSSVAGAAAEGAEPISEAAPKTPVRSTTIRATTCRICTPAPLPRVPTTTTGAATSPNTRREAEAAAEEGAGAAAAAAEAEAAAEPWNANAPTTTETKRETAIETEFSSRNAIERGSGRAVDATRSTTDTTPITPLHPLLTPSPPDSTDATLQKTIATGTALRARIWDPHTLRIRRRSAALEVNSSQQETSTTTTVPSSTATRLHATTATTTTTTNDADAKTTIPARAITTTWSTASTPTSPTRPSPPQPTPSSIPSPSPRTPSPTLPPPSPPLHTLTPSSTKSDASIATDASSESPTGILPIGHRTQDTSTWIVDTSPTATSPITITTKSEEATTTSDNTEPPFKKKPVVFLQHGLMGSSYDWVLAGPANGLAYLLADAGFDVWMGNARGNTYSRAHVYLPTKPSSPYWDFSFHEMAVYDLPAMFEYILNVTGASSVHYVGHSMGTTMFFALASVKPEVASNSISSMHALAPVAFVQHIKGPLRLLAPQVKRVQFLVHWLGLGEFLPQNFIIKWLTKWGCEKLKIEEEICENFMFVLCGFDKQQFNDSILPALLSHTPAGASTQTILHYAQMILSGRFRQFDYGILDNRRKYGSDEPPPYDLSRVDVPVNLMYAENDWLASVEDVKTLYKSLLCEKKLYKVPLKSFNHLDFILATDVKNLVNDRILEDLPRENEFTENSVSNY